MSNPIIKCDNLCKKFGTTPAVCGATLEVFQGHLLALLGPSGCGKTTVLRMIAGLEEPSSGTIEINGECVFSPSTNIAPEKRHVGMVFQEYALFPHMTVEENIRYGIGEKKDERTAAVLELVGLAHLPQRYPHELSGGQQQRVALARALAPRPSVILLDEPFSNLDTALRVRVRNEVREILRKADVTGIFVTHDQEEALSLADTVAVMMDGKIIQIDTPQKLYNTPATHQVATFLGDANFLPGTSAEGKVQCALGTLDTRSKVEGEVEIMFRPEALSLTIDPQGNGIIINQQYFGHDQLLNICLDETHTLKARTFGFDTRFRTGDRISVSLTDPVIAYPSPYGCPVIHL